MDLTPQQHQLWVANFFKGKVKEFLFDLKRIVRCCDQAMSDFLVGSPTDEDCHAEVLYALSGFSNAIMTLKDAGSTITGTKIGPQDIDPLRHGLFMRTCRNAATHDGHPILSLWTEGRFFVPTDILRFDDYGRLVQIQAPAVDARTFSLEFAHDFSVLLVSKLQPLAGLEGAKLDAKDVEKAFEFQGIPEFARELFQQSKAAIAQHLSSVKVYPVQQALDVLKEVKVYCASQLSTVVS
ncbi:hypothetical protein [Paraburkholderia caffeinitolerans]|nr:hypothetical protein [Paraburkholderia caffeinitolerans]